MQSMTLELPCLCVCAILWKSMDANEGLTKIPPDPPYDSRPSVLVRHGALLPRPVHDRGLVVGLAEQHCRIPDVDG